MGFEALARDVDGRTPAAELFRQARHADQVVALDLACALAALDAARAAPSTRAHTLFINVEPATLGRRDLGLHELLHERGDGLQLVLEVTERALIDDPAGLLATVADYRAAGWRIALDDVGAERESLALMPFLRPDVIKLDLRLVQQQPSPALAEIVHAVRAQAERTGAVVLAEGIETRDQGQLAQAMGAAVGQGFLLGAPGPLPAAPEAAVGRGRRAIFDTVLAAPPPPVPGGTPGQLLSAARDVRSAPKSLLVALARQLEQQALNVGESAVVLATFQHRDHFSAGTRRRYRALGERLALVVAFGRGLGPEPEPGVRGVELTPGDPLARDWDVVVVSPHFASALLAVDLGDEGPDEQRRFAYTVTYNRELVLTAASELLARVPPLRPALA